MAWTYDPMDTLIPNTTMVKGINEEGIHKNYRIYPNDGYVLHDNAADGIDYENEEAVVRRYSSGTCSCGAAYDFSTTEITVPDINGNNVIVTAYGEREFFAFPANLVPDPENNIYGGGNNHEVAAVEEETETE